ncbi:hypothetical protein [Methylomicrobium lacus]|uniref:hypothetical protein n=1 Tax=Methylomicrobium lacus TaxID=136992 RepID=UPI000563EBF5|nr:hypothetical protein [Methylomicrobium lacus]
MFYAERVYTQRNPTTGIMEWFFLAREGNFGPYRSKEEAKERLSKFICFCIMNNDDGGRGAGKNNGLQLSLHLEPVPEFSFKRREFRD